MTDHVETACPRCGEAATGCRFCPFCGLNLASISEVSTPDWEVGAASRQPSYEPLQPPSFATPAAADSNGASEHTAEEAFTTAVAEFRFDRFEDTTVEAIPETLEAVEEPAGSRWETSEPSQQPTHERLESPSSSWPSIGASEEVADEASAAAAGDVGSGPSIEEGIPSEMVDAESSPSDRDNPAPLGDPVRTGARLDGSLSYAAHTTTRRDGNQRATFAVLAAVIVLLVLMVSRSLRGRS